MNTIFELRNIPFVRLVIPLIIGLIISFHFKISLTIFIIITCLLFLFLIIIFLVNKLAGIYKLRLIFGISVYIFIIASGILLLESKFIYFEKTSIQIKSSEYYLCKVINQPEQKSETIKILLRIISYKDSVIWHNYRTKVLTYFQIDSSTNTLLNGDIIILKTKLQEVGNSKNPCEFDYKRFLEYKGIRYQSYIKAGTWKIIGHRGGLKIFASGLRNNLLGLYKKYGIKNNEFAVLSALTLGYTDELGYEIKRAFSSAGAMHVLSVSGLHVGIIFYVLNILIKFSGRIRYTKSIRLILIIIILWFYALLTGLSPSVIRASAMFTLIQIGISLNRTINIYNIIAASAFFIFIFDPLQISDIGCQLSFLAVLSIVFFQPRFYKLLIFKSWILDKIWILLTLSVSAQLGTSPIIMHYFHNFPLYFWLTNILIIYPAAVSIYLAILLFIFCPVNYMAFFIAEILNLVLKLINFFVLTIEKLPFSLIDSIYKNWTETILLYIIIISVSIFIIFKNRFYLKICLLCIICFLSVNLLRNYNINRQKKIIVFNINRFTVINFIEGRNNYLFTDLNLKKDSDIFLNSVRNYWLKHGVTKISKIFNINDSAGKRQIYDDIAVLHVKQLFDNLFINFRGEKLLLFSNTDLLKYTVSEKFRLDYLIITNNLKVPIKFLIRVFDIQNIVVDSSNNYWTRQFWDEECKAYGIDYHIISENGAIEIEL